MGKMGKIMGGGYTSEFGHVLVPSLAVHILGGLLCIF
jgi:hypothetical protein